MSKKTTEKQGKTEVRLTCVYSGDGESWGIGEVISVDAEEAARLIALGAAVET